MAQQLKTRRKRRQQTDGIEYRGFSFPHVRSDETAVHRSSLYVREAASSLWDPAILWNAKVPILKQVEITEIGSPHSHCHFGTLWSGKNSDL